MAKRKGKKDKQLSTKHTHQSNIEQQQILILSSPKYIRGMWSLKLGLLSAKTSSICRRKLSYEINVFGSHLSHV